MCPKNFKNDQVGRGDFSGLRPYVNDTAAGLREALQIPLQPNLLRLFLHPLNGLPDHLIQLHPQHFTALADDVAVYAGGKAFVLEFFLYGLHLQI